MNILKMNLLILAGFLLVLPAAQAQTQCQPDFPGEILLVCSDMAGDYNNPDLLQLESDTVTTYLQLHHIPQSESSIIYQYGRADLRNAIRGLMFDSLLSIINADPSTLTPHQQNLLNWFNGLVQNEQQAQFNDEVADINSWENNPCTWSPDPQVAAAYGLSYDAGEWCSGNPLVTAFSPGAPVPSSDYFAAAALKNSFGAQVTNFPYGSATEESLQQEGYLMYGYAAAPAAGLSAEAAAATYGFFLSSPSSQMLANAAAEEVTARLAINALGQTAGRTFEGLSQAEAIQAESDEAIAALDSSAAADFAAGPAAVVLLAVEIGVEAGFDFIDYNDAVDDLNSIKNNPPSQSLSDLATDSTGVGMYKLQTTFTAQTLPDTPSTQPLPEHRDGLDPHFVVQAPNSGTLTDTETLTYTDLAGTQWSVQTYEGFFLQTGTQTNGTVVNTILPTLTITDPQGTTWNVDWDGPTFLLTKTQPASTDTVCAADPTTGVSIVANVETCSSYVAFNFQLQDGTIVSLGQPPVFTSDSVAGEPGGQSFSVNITATGIPVGAIGPTGALPPGVFASGGGNGSLRLYSLGQTPDGTYSIPLQATNGTGTATQNFTLVVGTTPQIASADQFTDNRGVATTFTIHAAGYPIPKISLASNFCLPSGYTFHDNGNGTATISGNDTSVGFSFCTNNLQGNPNLLPGGTVTASNPVGTVTQDLTINVVYAPTPSVIGATNNQLRTTFTAGINNTFTVVTTGATTPVTFTLFPIAPAPPSWLHFQDNGNGTATFSGNPPRTVTPYQVNDAFVAVALGQNGNEIGQNVFINVSALPVFTDTGSQLYNVCPANNEPCFLNVHTNMANGAGTLSLAGGVPSGLTLEASGNTGQLSLETATGGAYPVTVNASDSAGSASQLYTFYMRQAPAFPQLPSGTDRMDIWLMAKVPANYSIFTTGYPHDIGVDTPGGTQVLPPMHLSLINGKGFPETLPAGLTFTDQTSAGIPTGTGLITGTPTEPTSELGDDLQIVANNGQANLINLNLYVRIAGDVNNDGDVNCTDVNTIKAALGSYVGQANYNVQADINNDGAVNVLDLALVAPYLPKGCPMQ